ncbi:MAG: hypothetical protein NPIRA05_18070 [Nitrospirales bacterium]|nr:MAG: hypothetical protein NPIRA05_18070 [Nitrospirales bacterium]
MLYFQIKPDLVFQAILHDALESERQEISRISMDNDIDTWEAGYGQMSEIFTPYSALVTIEQLYTASQTDTVYRLNDYHCLLIYECLKNYCAVHQDLAAQEEDQSLTISAYRLQNIDFQEMVDLYFWDTDFFFLSDTGPVPTLNEDSTCLEMLEATTLTKDLQPHPRYLKLTLVTNPMWKISQQDEFFHHSSRHYPDFS